MPIKLQKGKTVSLQKTIRSALFFALLFAVVFSVLVNSPLFTVSANPLPPPPDSEPITLDSNGAVTPASAPLKQTGNLYTLTSNLLNYSLTIQCSDITFDGAGHVLQGLGGGTGLFIANASDVTVRNLRVNQFGRGIKVSGNSNMITKCEIAHCSTATSLEENSENSTITENTISDNTIGISISSNGNLVYLNNFANNVSFDWTSNPSAVNIVFGPYFDPLNSELYRGNTFSNGSIGNYYSDYKAKYPNATIADYSGTADTPYLIASSTNTTDPHPLWAPNGNLSSPFPTIHVDYPHSKPIQSYTFAIILLAILAAVVGYVPVKVAQRRRNRGVRS